MLEDSQNSNSWFREKLTAAGYSSAAAFANGIGVPRSNAYQWERGQCPPARLLPTIANALKVSVTDLLENLWREKDEDDCPCGKCGGKKSFADTPPEARTLAIVIPCAKCGVKRIRKRWKKGRHRSLCPKCASTVERKEFRCGGYRDHDAIRHTKSCRSIWLRPAEINARERLKERFPDSRFDACSQTYQCNSCASTERLIEAQEERLREIESRESGDKKSNIRIWTRDDRLELFQKRRHLLYGGKLKTAFTARAQEKGRQKHAANAAAGAKYPRKIGANLKRRWLANFLPKRLSVGLCIVCKKFQFSNQSQSPRFHKICHDQVWERSQEGREFQSLKVTQALERKRANLAADLSLDHSQTEQETKHKRGRPKRHSDKDELFISYCWMIQHLAGSESLHRIAKNNQTTVQTVANHIHSLATIMDSELLAEDSQPKVRFLLDAYDKKYPGKRRVNPH